MTTRDHTLPVLHVHRESKRSVARQAPTSKRSVAPRRLSAWPASCAARGARRSSRVASAASLRRCRAPRALPRRCARTHWKSGSSHCGLQVGMCTQTGMYCSWLNTTSPLPSLAFLRAWYSLPSSAAVSAPSPARSCGARARAQRWLSRYGRGAHQSVSDGILCAATAYCSGRAAGSVDGGAMLLGGRARGSRRGVARGVTPTSRGQALGSALHHWSRRVALATAP